MENLSLNPILLSIISGQLGLIIAICIMFAKRVLSKIDNIEKKSDQRFKEVKIQIDGLQHSTDAINSDTSQYKKILKRVDDEVQQNTICIKKIKKEVTLIGKETKTNTQDIKYIIDRTNLLDQE